MIVQGLGQGLGGLPGGVLAFAVVQLGIRTTCPAGDLPVAVFGIGRPVGGEHNAFLVVHRAEVGMSGAKGLLAADLVRFGFGHPGLGILTGSDQSLGPGFLRRRPDEGVARVDAPPGGRPEYAPPARIAQPVRALDC